MSCDDVLCFPRESERLGARRIMTSRPMPEQAGVGLLTDEFVSENVCSDPLLLSLLLLLLLLLFLTFLSLLLLFPIVRSRIVIRRRSMSNMGQHLSLHLTA